MQNYENLLLNLSKFFKFNSLPKIIDEKIKQSHNIEKQLNHLLANQMRYNEVVVPSSNLKLEIVKILKAEGYINDYKVEKGQVQDNIVITLKYGKNKERVISGLKRISKPGLRVYAKAEEIPTVLNGLGISIVSTSKGIMTGKEARKENLGGEVLAYVW